MEKVAYLILAAGNSSRMGQPKQLLSLGKDKLLMHEVLNQVLKVANPKDVFVVLGANYKEINLRLKDYSVTIVCNLIWKQGIGTSISCGIKKIQSTNTYQNCMVLLADQPTVTSKEIYGLKKHHLKQKALLTVTVCNNYKGVPAVFHQEMYKELIALNEDIGAKKIIQKNLHLVEAFRVDKEIIDIDKPEDYQKLIKKIHRLL